MSEFELGGDYTTAWLGLNTTCSPTFGGGCLVYERLVVSIMSAVSSAVLATVLMRNAIRRTDCGKGGPRCEAAWPKLHHYALLFVALADLLVALNYAVVSTCVCAFVHLCVHACVRACVRARARTGACGNRVSSPFAPHPPPEPCVLAAHLRVALS